MRPWARLPQLRSDDFDHWQSFATFRFALGLKFARARWSLEWVLLFPNHRNAKHWRRWGEHGWGAEYRWGRGQYRRHDEYRRLGSNDWRIEFNDGRVGSNDGRVECDDGRFEPDDGRFEPDDRRVECNDGRLQ